ncbi:MAG TPA: PAS domain S-box protein, partial [Bacteroidales bacterium]|nr:PAS domain S-box protein [Bacteroidales bacterium]
PDVIIYHYSVALGGSDFTTTLQKQKVPLIVINDSGNELAAVECMKAGAADYITRDRIESIADSVKDTIVKRRSENEKIKNEISISTHDGLKSTLIDSVPYIALVIRKHTREIVACNKTAIEAGAVIGKTCYETISDCNHECSFCKASLLWESGKEQSVKNEFQGRHWEGKWLPYSDDLYIHYIWDSTELVETREELQESRQRISDALEFNRKILNSSSLGILAYNQSGQCVTANIAAAKIVGTTVENILNQNFNRIPSWKKSGMYQAAVETLRTGEDHVLEIHDSSSFGREAWLNASFSSFDSKGEQHLLLILSDISRRKMAEDLLRKSENRFKSIFESNFISVAFWNNRGEIMDANDSFLNLIGYTRDDLLWGKVNWAKMTPPEYTHLDINALKELRETGICKPFEKEYIRKDGTRIHIMLGGATIEGIYQGGVTYIIDIRERKKAEKALKESEENMRYIVKHDPNAIAIFDRNLHYIAVSDRYLRDYSVREEDIIGKHHYDVFPEMPQRWKDV